MGTGDVANIAKWNGQYPVIYHCALDFLPGCKEG